MNLNIQTLSCFDKDVKRLFKKYKQLPNDLKVLNKKLLENPKSGSSRWIPIFNFKNN
jgi:mRNA-degrading endonuclease YafQ of YafQ-DinJ toxin-antitoxin module